MEDERIVALYWQRSEQAVRETDRRYGRYLWSIAYRVLADREDCDECVNDTYLAAWNSLPPQHPAVLATYLGRIIRGLAIDRRRRHAALKRPPSEYALSLDELAECCAAETEQPQQTVEARALAAEISRWLCTLDAPLRQAFISRYYFFDPIREIAARQGMTEGQLKTALCRVRKALKEHLLREGLME